MDSGGLSRVLALLMIVLVAVCCTHAYESECCSGIKEMHNILYCDSPCCPGHREVVSENVPIFGDMVVCEKEKKVNHNLPSFDLFGKFGRRRRSLE